MKMWPDTPIERKLKENFNQGRNELENTDHFIPSYDAVKSYMIQHIYPNIAKRKKEYDLTDHGESHIQDVLRKAFDILQHAYINPNDWRLSDLELYLLCMGILVHDIGNLDDREDHELKIVNFFTSKQFPMLNEQVRRSTIRIARAHGGKGDTIEKLSSHRELIGQEINSTNVAALLRFADELAEGPQRTSSLMLEKALISDSSILYHRYAQITRPPCLQAGSVIANYEIPLTKIVNDQSIKETRETLKPLLKFIFIRTHKLNRERIYCGLYSDCIHKITNVSVSITFFEDQDSIDEIDLPAELTNFRLTNLDCNDYPESPKQDPIVEILDKLFPQEHP